MTIAATEPVPQASPVARRIVRVESTPPPQPGFIGEGHTAVEVLSSDALSVSDPFVLLMDDRLSIAKRRQIGGAHPHAGLETVTLVLEGSVTDRDEGELSAGDAAWMTAGRGIVHSENVEAEGNVRILQLWIGLPKASRFAEPANQILRSDQLPVRREPGVLMRLYSGQSGPLRAKTKNLVPVTLATIELEPNAAFELELPSSHTGFLYVTSGNLEAGADRRPVRTSEVAWLDRPSSPARSQLTLTAGPTGARAVLYAGEPHTEPLVQHGPFVADSEATVTRFYGEYRSGGFTRLSELGQRAHANRHDT